LSGGLYVGSSGRSFSSSSAVSGRGLIAIGLSAVFCSVLAAFLVILGSEAAEGAPFSSQIVLGTGVRLDLRTIMLEDRSNGVVQIKKKKERQERKVLAR
jgi:hypothetical protein